MDPRHTLKRSLLNKILRSLFFFAIVASIAISGIIRPLLVQCTLADGRTTLELIGQDPHHHMHSGHSCEYSNSSSDILFPYRVVDCDADGACVDRFLNHTAILRTASCDPLPLSVWGVFEKLSAQIFSRAVPASVLFPDSSSRTSFHLQFKQPLLI